MPIILCRKAHIRIVMVCLCLAFITVYLLEILSAFELKLKSTRVNNTLQLKETTNDDLRACPLLPPRLQGRLTIDEKISLKEAEGNITWVRKGGIWCPYHCKALWRVAIIVPFRDRYIHLGPFLNHMHKFLQRQELNYSMYIIEQEGHDPFNRASLMNVGYLEAKKAGPWDCFIFHDVDFLPEDDRHLYHCAAQPRHLAVAIDRNNYKLHYKSFIGGGVIMTTDQIEAINGWSNLFWGWGSEDDELWNRINLAHMAVWRYPEIIARYKSLTHKKQPVNKQRQQILKSNYGKHDQDGLNTLHYSVKNVTFNPLYTHVLTLIRSKAA